MAASAGAVEMCSGLGACRKTLRRHDVPVLHGHARREAHSTRGRANVLRLAHERPARRSGPRRRGRPRGARPLPRMPRLQERVSGRRRHGALQERVSRRLLGPARHAAVARGRSGTCATWRASAAGSRRSSNAATASRLGRALANEALLGLDRRRTLPAWTRRTLRGRLARRDRALTRGAAVLCSTTPSPNYYEPEIGVAAVEVLDRRRRSAAARAARLLRPSADLAGPARRGAATAGANGRGAVSTPRRAVRPSSSSSRAACRRSARTRRHCCAAGAANARRRWPAAACSSRSSRSRSGRPGARRCRCAPDPPPSLLHGALSSEVDGPGRRRRARCCARIPGRHGHRPRRRLLRHGRLVRLHARALRRLAPDRRAQLLPAARALGGHAVLVAAGISCRHQVARLRRGRRPPPGGLLRSLLEESA